MHARTSAARCRPPAASRWRRPSRPRRSRGGCPPMRCEMTAAVLVLGAIGAAGCATPGHDKESWESAWHGEKAAAAPAGAKGPKLAAQEYIPPLDCERKA